MEEKNLVEEENIILIDVSNLLYRMYFVHKELKNASGIYTGGVYGFFNMLLYYIDKLKTTKFILVWDVETKSNWRFDIFENYKHNRKQEVDEEKQIVLDMLDLSKKYIFEISKFLGYINLGKFSFEADDIFFLFLRRIRKNIKIITMDKDLLQLVNDRFKVRVYRPGLRYGTYKIYNEAEVLKEFNVNANQFDELLAIAGDAVDGIPGIPGFAYKKGSKIINEANEKNISVRDLLNEDQQAIYDRNIILVSKNSVPGDLKQSDFKVSKVNFTKAQKLLDDLEIKKYKATDLVKIKPKQSFTEELIKNFIS